MCTRASAAAATLAATALIILQGCRRPASPDSKHLEKAGPTPGRCWPELEREIERRTNGERTRRGLRALAGDETLRQVARSHSGDMLARYFFAHVNPDGASPAERVAAAHRRLVGVVGENIYKYQGPACREPAPLAERIVGGWMRSPGHRRNILEARFTHLAVGAVNQADQLLVTQLFADVRALLEPPPPPRLERGSRLRVAALPVGGSGPPELFDLWSGQNGRRVLGPMPLAETELRVPAGAYQLRLYFPGGRPGLYEVYPGPRILVR